jgi:hypothetical protein
MKKYLIPFLALLVLSASCGNNHDSASTTTESTEAAPAPAAETAASEKETDATSADQSATHTAPGQITAGEWRDADHWDFWQSLMKPDIYGSMQKHWSFNLNNRVAIKAVTSQGTPVADMPIKLLSADKEPLWESRTNNKGEADLFPLLQDKSQQGQQELMVQVGDGEPQKLKHTDETVNRMIVSAGKVSHTLDVAFVVDATGSMGDEMDYLKAELTDVIHQVADNNPGLEINTAALFYRDEDDDYLTRKSGFTTDISETVGFIKEQRADGGGDFPEAVHSALDEALKELDWSGNARARILFLVLDAPPHHDPAVIRKVHQLVALAARKGVRIVPVVSSGIDKETEFLMRYMAIATGGTYLFLTDDSGIGNSHLQATVGKYEVEYLNALLVRVIDEYVATRNTRTTTQY